MFYRIDASFIKVLCYSFSFSSVLYLSLGMSIAAADQSAAVSKQAFSLDKQQQAFVFEHMRSMLETLAEIQLVLAKSEPEQVANLVEKLERKKRSIKPKGIGKAFPPAFRQLSKGMDQHWANLLKPSSDAQYIQRELNQVLNHCNACHRSFTIRRH